MTIISALISGLLFGLGMIISGMINPAKILNFLDITGTWDPSLAFALGGAILIGIPGFWLTRRRQSPFFSDIFHLPTRNDLDPKLVTGGAIFGIGWGVSGYCPGPAFTSITLTSSDSLIFIVAMIAGIMLTRILPQSSPITTNPVLNHHEK